MATKEGQEQKVSGRLMCQEVGLSTFQKPCPGLVASMQACCGYKESLSGDRWASTLLVMVMLPGALEGPGLRGLEEQSSANRKEIKCLLPAVKIRCFFFF